MWLVPRLAEATIKNNTDSCVVYDHFYFDKADPVIPKSSKNQENNTDIL